MNQFSHRAACWRRRQSTATVSPNRYVCPERLAASPLGYEPVSDFPPVATCSSLFHEIRHLTLGHFRLQRAMAAHSVTIFAT